MALFKVGFNNFLIFVTIIIIYLKIFFAIIIPYRYIILSGFYLGDIPCVSKADSIFYNLMTCLKGKWEWSEF